MEIAGEIEIDATLVPDGDVRAVEAALFEEVGRIQSAPPSEEEVQRAINRLEAHFVRQLESVGGFGGRADLLNYFNVFAGDPGRLNGDFERYASVRPADVQRVAARYLGPGRVRLLVSPEEAVAAAPVVVDRTQQPPPAPEPSFRPPTPRRLQLGGGLDLLVVGKREVPTIALALYFAGGAVSDPAAQPGLASFTGRLMMEGTQTRSSIQIADEGDFIAARPSIGIDREGVVVSTEALTRHWPRALALLADVLRNPSFPAAEIERVRQERLTDLRRLGDDANAIASRLENGLLFGPETPHGHPISGREAAVAAFGRDELVALHAAVMGGARPTFLVVGDVDAEAVARQLEEAFAGWPAAAAAPTPASAAERAPTTIYLVDKPGAAQSVIAASQVTVARTDPDYAALSVMHMAFGGQFTARLNMNLREDKGYTYGYRSRFDWRRDQSSFGAGGAVQTAVTKEALVETLKEFADLQGRRPLTEEEFEKSRLGMIRGFPPTFETPGQVLRRLVDLAHFGLPDDYYEGHVARLEAVTLADLHRVAAAHVDADRLTVVVVGDRAAVEPGLRELGLPLETLDYESLA